MNAPTNWNSVFAAERNLSVSRAERRAAELSADRQAGELALALSRLGRSVAAFVAGPRRAWPRRAQGQREGPLTVARAAAGLPCRVVLPGEPAAR